MDNPTFEASFTSLAKGLPDLERIVARIHAGSCKAKDFLNVLGVSVHSLDLDRSLTLPQHFRVLSDGLSTLATASEGFASRSILGLLRSAPDLEPYLDNVEGLFTISDEGVA